jgi:hypothetical protein
MDIPEHYPEEIALLQAAQMKRLVLAQQSKIHK